MSASLPNIAAPSAPGPSAGASAAASGAKATAAAAAKSAMKDPVAGFEALMASLFGTQGQSDAAGDPAKTATKDLAGTIGKTTDSGADSASGTAPATEAAAGADSVSADAVLALLGQPQPVATPNVAATAPADAEATLAGGARAKSAAPAISLQSPTVANLSLADGKAPAAAASAAAKAATAAAADTAAAGTVAPPVEPPIGKIDTPVPPKVAEAQTPPQSAAPTPTPVSAPVVAPPTIAEAAAVAVVTAATPAVAVEAKPTEGPAPVAAAPKEKAQAGKPARADAPRIDAAAPTVGKVGDAPVEAVDSGPNPGAGDKDPQTADAAVQPGERNTGPTDSNASTSSTITPATLTHAAAVGVRGSPQTVANLAAQIAKKLEGRSSRFDLQLDPIGLGRVDVRMEIGASGRMTAAMTFETPQAASELRARASDLQRQLEQAGFDLSGGMTFDVAGDRGQGRQAQHQDTEPGQAFRGRAFQSALATAGEAATSAQAGALNPRRRALSSVDIRI